MLLMIVIKLNAEHNKVEKKNGMINRTLSRPHQQFNELPLLNITEFYLITVGYLNLIQQTDTYKSRSLHYSPHSDINSCTH